MPLLPLSGKSLRLTRLSRPGDGKFLIVPMDHSVADGPIADAAGFSRIVGDVVAAGADAIVVHKGRARSIEPGLLKGAALIVHLSASTPHALDGDAKVLVGGVEEAVRAGADAVSVHINIGSDTEKRQLADLGAVSASCDRWGMPLLAMMYARGPRIQDPRDPALLAHVVGIAVDLGADLVKTVAADTAEDMAGIVAKTPVPVVLAGGPGGGRGLSDFAHFAMDTGCRGLAVGRQVFHSPDPAAAVRTLTAAVHGPRPETAPKTTSLPELAGAM
ncbi:fructose-bisphosphate aldolase [Streptomyces piniterrae]|uniref:Fructose-bisphosphate aldolase n=1 Tax=Streptomyces piniterrae TaxID=2571125 RepID=A0A4U0NST1_9ACTN|nr:2-amino-3,7-dideoxy-D-threo-hept-6-ulosonate synthase [Streptomyces piniterrae]TJZ57112.1 fructose-bisphosphate aldolase [Streptomyces piniterrae]